MDNWGQIELIPGFTRCLLEGSGEDWKDRFRWVIGFYTRLEGGLWRGQQLEGSGGSQEDRNRWSIEPYTSAGWEALGPSWCLLSPFPRHKKGRPLRPSSIELKIARYLIIGHFFVVFFAAGNWTTVS